MVIAHRYANPIVRAGSLITSLLGDVVMPYGGHIWLGSLLDLLEPLGLSE